MSGDVHLNRLETEIINTRDFQRLRRIKQLGTTYLVYPTALHTRFDHSLGTLEMADTMIRSIRENKHNSPPESEIPIEDEQLIRLLALLHDVTHVPFGHTLEDESCVFTRHDQNADRISRFIGQGSPIGKVIQNRLGLDMYSRFTRIFTVEKENLEGLGDDLYIYDLVSNTVCADLLDYLRRDCYFCNLVVDTEYRFLNFLYLRKDKGKRRLVIRLWKEGKPRARPDTLSELVRLLDNRYVLAERVYFHHAKLISGAMLSDAVLREKEQGGLKDDHELWESGDEVLLNRLSLSKIPAVRVLGSALVERRLWKGAYQRPRSRVDGEQRELRDIGVMDLTMEYWWRDARRRLNDEEYIGGLFGLNPGELVFYCPDSRMNMKAAEMNVFWNGQLQALKNCADDPLMAEKLRNILKSHEQLWAIAGYLHPDRSEKREEIEGACDYLFSFEKQLRPERTKQFYHKVAERIVREHNLDAEMGAQESRRRVDVAVGRLCADTLGDRSITTVEQVIRNAFIEGV